MPRGKKIVHENASSPIEQYRRSARIRHIAESATKASQHLREDQALLGGSQATKSRTPKLLQKTARGAKTSSHLKKAIDSSITKPKPAVQSPISRPTARSTEAAAAPTSHPTKKTRGRPKSVADSIEQPEQDLGSNVHTRFLGTSKHRTNRLEGDTGQTRGGPLKAHLTATAKHSSLALDYPQAGLNSEFRGRDHLEQSGLLNHSSALTKEVLEAHTCDSAPITFADQIRAIKRIFGNTPETQSPGTADIDPQEEFNYKWGYLPPLGEEAERILGAMLENPELAEIMVRTGPDSKGFRLGLEKRNVVISESRDPDPRAKVIGEASIEEYLEETMDQQRVYDDLWQLDCDKCSLSSSEALFQRTLMISLIARHSLIYHQNEGGTQLLDFVVEEPWSCLPMPTKAVWRIPEHLAYDFKFLTQPKPDLAICFDRNSLLPEDVWMTLPEATQALASFENSDAGASRLFHFLTIEAKKAILKIEEPKALYQSLNNASQALYNMFEFFRDAGPQHEKIFFNKVRYFSAVANGDGILIRIHRAIQLRHEESRLFVMPDEPKYRLRFVYRTFERISGTDHYNRARVLGAFKKILKYATDDLSQWIKDAASDLANKLEKDQQAFNKRRELNFYRYGQPGPRPSRQTYKSATPSVTTENISLTQRFENADVNNNQTLKYSVTSEPTPTQENLHVSPSSNPSKRKRGKQSESENSVNQMPLEPPAPPAKRLRPS